MKRKTVLGVMGVLLAFLIIKAGWTRTYGTATTEEGLSVIQTSDGGYLVAGFSEAADGMWVVKTDPQGDTLWCLASELDWRGGKGTSVIETVDGHYVVAGYAAPVWDGRYHLVILKINSSGEVIWCKGDLDWYEPAPGSLGYSIVGTTDGGYIVTGAFSHAFEEIDDLLLIKLDEAADTVWTRSYGGDAPDCGHCVRQTTDGGYIIAGYSDFNTPSPLPYSFWLVKTDENGDTVWTSGMPDMFFGRAYSVTGTSDGGYMATGYVAPFEDGKYHFVVLKIDADGDTLWSRWDFDLFPGALGGVGRCIKPTTEGNYIIAGYTTGFLDEVLDLLLMKLTPDGDTLWTRTYGGVDQDMGYCVNETSDGGFIITGATSSFGAGSSDLWLLRTDARGDTLGIQERQEVLQPHGWSVDNSVCRAITLRYSNYPSGFRAQVFDAAGRKVDELRSPGPSGSLTWGAGFAPGVYFVHVITGSPATARKVILID